MNKREWVLKAMRNEETDRIPAGFWYHYLQDELQDGLADPSLIEQNISGHRKFYSEYQPDFLKIMTDGFFLYPNEIFSGAEKVSELRGIKPIGEKHPWIEKQVEFAKTITALFGKEVLCFYNIFSPATTFRFVRQGRLGKRADDLLARFTGEDPKMVRQALDTVSQDLGCLARRVIAEGGADGIYFSTQDPEGLDGEGHKKAVSPSDISVLEEAGRAGSAKAQGALNLLHVCGYEGHRNDLSRYRDYPAQVINWASVCEKVSLAEGKKLFHDKPVIGGFDNTPGSLLFTGGEEAVKAETRRLIAGAGRKGVILGADCTIPRKTEIKRLNWVREACIL
ncbi:MAG: uroporphyrinogen decarboxylase [Treponema sp.]|jgi:uroporphyrinogen decarboxylase|nr:uroporphyrinogen decarboxylase [Treponema sp.]